MWYGGIGFHQITVISLHYSTKYMNRYQFFFFRLSYQLFSFTVSSFLRPFSFCLLCFPFFGLVWHWFYVAEFNATKIKKSNNVPPRHAGLSMRVKEKGQNGNENDKNYSRIASYHICSANESLAWQQPHTSGVLVS